MSEVNRAYVRFVCGRAGVLLPLKSKMKGYIICPECGEPFVEGAIEQYIEHAERHPSLMRKRKSVKKPRAVSYV